MDRLLLLHETDLGRLVERCRWFLWAGLLVLALAAFTTGLGVVTGFMAVWLGAVGCSLERWQTERGLWMLASLFYLICLPLYLLLTVFSTLDAIQNRRTPLPVAVDLMIAMRLMWLQSKLTYSIIRINRAIPPESTDQVV